MNGVPRLIWYALNQTVASLWEWLLIKGAWTCWMHATLASGYIYIFIAPLPNLIKMGDKLCTVQTISVPQTGFAPCFIANPWGFSLEARTHVKCLVSTLCIYVMASSCMWSKNKSSSVVEFLEPFYNHNLIVPLILQILFNNSALVIGDNILLKKKKKVYYKGRCPELWQVSMLGSAQLMNQYQQVCITCCVLSQLTRQEISHVAYVKSASNLHHKQPKVQSNQTRSMLLLFPHES